MKLIFALAALIIAIAAFTSVTSAQQSLTAEWIDVVIIGGGRVPHGSDVQLGLRSDGVIVWRNKDPKPPEPAPVYVVPK